MKTINTTTALFLTLLLTSQGADAAGIPVFDATTAANFLSTLENDQTKITALQTQLGKMQQQIQMNTGSRGMGALATSGTASEWGGVLQQVMNTTGSYGQVIANVIAQRALLTVQQKARMSPVQQEILARLWQLGAIQKVMAEVTTTKASRQLTEIQTLSSQIDNASDPKAIADLNAAMAAKKLELDNTRLQLYAMEQQMQAEQKMIELRQREMEIMRAGTTSSVAVHIR